MWHNAKKFFTYFSLKLDLTASTNNWYVANCPFCGKAGKFSLHFEYHLAKCWVCDFRASLIDCVMELEGLTFEKAKQLILHQADSVLPKWEENKTLRGIELPIGFSSLLDQDSMLAKRACKYLQQRGFDPERLDSMGFGYGAEPVKEFAQDFFGYIIIPFKEKGKLIYYQGRDFLGREERYKYKNPPSSMFGVGKADCLFNEAALYEDRVFITEGWACALTLGDACSTQGWALSSTQVHKILISPARELVFVPDKGWSKLAIKQARPFLDCKKVRVINLDYAPKKDANELGKDYIMELYAKTHELTYRDVLKSLRD